MSKYKPLTEPITRREACLILDRQRFDSAVRNGDIVPLGKMSTHLDRIVAPEDGARTSPLMFDQEVVRKTASEASNALATEGRDLRKASKAIAKQTPPLTRRHIDGLLGKKLTGILIRGGVIVPNGALTDTQTAAHTYDPAHVAEVIDGVADQRYAEAKLLSAGAKTRIPA